MEALFLQFLGPLIGAIIGGVAAYVAIRADLAELKARMSIAEKVADNAHERIDSIMQRRRRDDTM